VLRFIPIPDTDRLAVLSAAIMLSAGLTALDLPASPGPISPNSDATRVITDMTTTCPGASAGSCNF